MQAQLYVDNNNIGVEDMGWAAGRARAPSPLQKNKDSGKIFFGR